MPFSFKGLALPGLILVQPRVFADERGWFMETYKRSDFEKHGIPAEFHQDNHSRSTRAGTIRGLHYQLPPHAQGKLVRCVAGEVFDVAVDIRRDSPTFRQWEAVRLSAKAANMLWVPEGFAHGFMTLTDDAEVAYKVTREYAPTSERSIRWDDPALAIEWPLADALLAKKDAEAPFLSAVENPF